MSGGSARGSTRVRASQHCTGGMGRARLLFSRWIARMRGGRKDRARSRIRFTTQTSRDHPVPIRRSQDAGRHQLINANGKSIRCD
jgi:hypothetical protein